MLNAAATTARIMSADANGADAAPVRRGIEPAVARDVAQSGHRSVRQAGPEEVPAPVPAAGREHACVAGAVRARAMRNNIVDGCLREVGADFSPGAPAIASL